MTAGVELDTSELERGVRQLGAALEQTGARVGMDQARATSTAIRGRVHVLTGRLRSTVEAVAVEDGGGVTYGGDLAYARKIERRYHAVADSLVGAPERFYRAMTAAASVEVSRL